MLPTSRWKRGILGGLLGGLVSLLMAFVLLQVVGGSIIFDPDLQSQKFIAIWHLIDPLPLTATNPLLYSTGWISLGAAHGLVFVYIVNGLPATIIKRGLAYGIILWALISLFFEFTAPFNLLGEPPLLVAFQLLLWIIVYLAEGLIISAIYGNASY